MMCFLAAQPADSLPRLLVTHLKEGAKGTMKEPVGRSRASGLLLSRQENILDARDLRPHQRVPSCRQRSCHSHFKPWPKPPPRFSNSFTTCSAVSALLQSRCTSLT